MASTTTDKEIAVWMLRLAQEWETVEVAADLDVAKGPVGRPDADG